MVRVFASLAAADLLLMVAVAIAGFWVDGDHLYPAHFILAICALLLAVLVHVVAVTYLSATGRMMNQALWVAHLDKSPLEQVRSNKRGVLCSVSAAFVTLLIQVMLGGLVARDSGWSTSHMLAGILVIGVNAWAFFAELCHVDCQSRLMKSVFDEFNKRNREKGTIRTVLQSHGPPDK